MWDLVGNPEDLFSHNEAQTEAGPERTACMQMLRRTAHLSSAQDLNRLSRGKVQIMLQTLNI